ncbi:MAG: hypothetical protein JWO57_566, partial [Pseudonocardiales bacterium]|nr:hypothetical protein [Pseudonocardiales bacterium]
MLSARFPTADSQTPALAGRGAGSDQFF